MQTGPGSTSFLYSDFLWLAAAWFLNVAYVYFVRPEHCYRHWDTLDNEADKSLPLKNVHVSGQETEIND